MFGVERKAVARHLYGQDFISPKRLFQKRRGYGRVNAAAHANDSAARAGGGNDLADPLFDEVDELLSVSHRTHFLSFVWNDVLFYHTRLFCALKKPSRNTATAFFL